MFRNFTAAKNKLAELDKLDESVKLVGSDK